MIGDRSRWWAPALGGVTGLVLGAISCATAGAFACQQDSDCEGAGPQARCEPSGYCSFEDESCDDGHRYAEHAGEGLGGACVGAIGTGDTSGTTGSSGDDPGPTLDGGSTSGSSGPDPNTTDDTGPVIPPEDWWDCQWGARRELTIEVPALATDLVDVPVLVVLDDSRIDPTVMAADGHDLRFRTEDDTAALDHEIEQWSATGLSWVWLRIPTLTPGTNRVLMYYGHPSAPPGPDPTAVWGEHVGVFHLGSPVVDATGQSTVLESVGESTDGQAGSGQRFVDPEGGIRVMPAATVDALFEGGGTITAMVRPSVAGGPGLGAIVGRSTTDNGDGGWVLSVDRDRAALRFAQGFAVNRRLWLSPDGSLPLEAWHHVAVVYDDASNTEVPALYIDGVLQRLDDQGAGSGGADDEAMEPLLLGGEPLVASQWFPGILDEIRLSPGPRPPEWITIEVASLRDELVTYGAPQASPCAPEGPQR